MPKSSVPERWTDYSPFLSVIKNTRFLPIKVPLKDEICRRVDPEFRFTPDDFLELCEDNSFKIGLIIDLTFTSRYYDYQVFEERGIKYEKIATGGGVIPDDSVTDKFRSVVKDFLSDDDTDSLIAVHCTHGVNRTGYIVCHYMITQMNIGIEEAIESYAEARGYPIERPNYLNGLRELNLNEGPSSQTKVDDEGWIEIKNYRRHHLYSQQDSYVPNTSRKARSSWRNRSDNGGPQPSFDFRRRPYDRPTFRPHGYSQGTFHNYHHQSSRDRGYDEWRTQNNSRSRWYDRSFVKNWRSGNDNYRNS